jgi:hypothetical protein
LNVSHKCAFVLARAAGGDGRRVKARRITAACRTVSKSNRLAGRTRNTVPKYNASAQRVRLNFFRPMVFPAPTLAAAGWEAPKDGGSGGPKSAHLFGPLAFKVTSLPEAMPREISKAQRRDDLLAANCGRCNGPPYCATTLPNQSIQDRRAAAVPASGVATVRALRPSRASRRHSAAYLKDSSLSKSSCGFITNIRSTSSPRSERQQTKARLVRSPPSC